MYTIIRLPRSSFDRIGKFSFDSEIKIPQFLEKVNWIRKRTLQFKITFR